MKRNRWFAAALGAVLVALAAAPGRSRAMG